MTPKTTEYGRKASGLFTKGGPPGPAWRRKGPYPESQCQAIAEGQRRAWADPEKREHKLNGTRAMNAARRGKPAWNRKEPVVRVCHYPGCEVVISTPPSFARVKACCKQHQYIPKDRRDSPYTADWPMIRVAVWERDGYRCLTCQAQPKRPECHHLDYDKENNEQANLATQCSGCHQGGHRRNAWPIGLSQRASQ